MKKICKYSLENWNHQKIMIPEKYKILYVDIQYEVPCIWAEVIIENDKIEENFTIVSTKQDVPDNSIHIGSFQMIDMESFIFHIYKEVKND